MQQTLAPVDSQQLRWFRIRRSGLFDPFPNAGLAAEVLGGVQAQIHPSAGLALFNRTPNLTYARYEALLYEERSLVKLWGQRGTLHIYATGDWPRICAMLAGSKSWWARAAEKAETYDAYMELVRQAEALLRQKGVMGRSDLRASGLFNDEEHLSPWGGVFADLVRRGHACHAARSGEGLFAHRAFWRPDLRWEPPEPDAANVEMARRYLRAYGPATFQDYAHWRGAERQRARRWWAALEPELAQVSVNGQAMHLLREDLEEFTRTTEPPFCSLHMLHRFDPLLLAHKDKSWIVPAAHYKRVFRSAGHIEGVVLDAGVAVATWRYARKGDALRITLEPFNPLPARLHALIQQRSLAIATFFGLTQAEVEGI
jgi:hypothetical protein